MKTLLFACYHGTIIIVVLCIGLFSCSKDEIEFSSYAESSAIFKQNGMDTIMFNVLADRWDLGFQDSTKAVLKITVHPGYFQPDQIDPYGSSIQTTRGYEVLTSLVFENSPEILLLEGFQFGDYPYNYSFTLHPSIGTYPSLTFDLLYYYNEPTIIEGVFYNKSGKATHFTGTN